MSEQNEQQEPQQTEVPEPRQETPGAEPVAQLRYIDNSGPTDQLYHVGPRCVIGRFDPSVAEVDVDLTDLPDSKYVSRTHALIEHEDGTWYLTDQGSSNGTHLYRAGAPTFVKASEREEIRDGDEIVFANIRFRFEIPPPFDTTEAEPAPSEEA